METIVLSDLHLTEAEPVDPDRPLWKAYKQRRFFFDSDFAKLLDHIDRHAKGPLELVLNGDIFDFDSVTKLPENPQQPIGWLAKRRGLGSEEWMSLFKLEVIINDHLDWFAALRAFIAKGHAAVFVIGNHDAELVWTSVQDRIRRELQGADEQGNSRLSFCRWFYLSENDTYVTHGHQFDPYCTVRDPTTPFICVSGRLRVRLPFGDLAMRYMLNGMGYFNPHATGNYIMSAWEYVRFYFRHMVRTQPLLFWSWFWSSLVTLGISLWEFWHPAFRDPLRVEDNIQAIADQSRASPAIVRMLNALHVPSACTNPYLVMRELWLDRVLIFLLMFYIAGQIILTINFVWPISLWWALVPLVLLFPLFILYSFRVQVGAFSKPLIDAEQAELIHKITKARTVILGHTHEPQQTQVGPLTVINEGFWSPAFAEPQCQNRIGSQTFAWVKPDLATPDGPRRVDLHEWPAGADEPRPYPSTNESDTARS